MMVNQPNHQPPTTTNKPPAPTFQIAGCADESNRMKISEQVGVGVGGRRTIVMDLMNQCALGVLQTKVTSKI